MHKTVCAMVVFVWKNILAQHSGMESVRFFNFLRGAFFQARVTLNCNSQTGEFWISENVWSIFLIVLYVLKSVEFAAFLNLPEHLMVLSVHPATTVPALLDEKSKFGEGRRKGMGGWYSHENLGSTHPLTGRPCNVLCDLAAAAVPQCTHAHSGCSTQGVSSATVQAHKSLCYHLTLWAVPWPTSMRLSWRPPQDTAWFLVFAAL